MLRATIVAGTDNAPKTPTIHGRTGVSNSLRKYASANATVECTRLFPKAPAVPLPGNNSAWRARLEDSNTPRITPCARYNRERPHPHADGVRGVGTTACTTPRSRPATTTPLRMVNTPEVTATSKVTHDSHEAIMVPSATTAVGCPATTSPCCCTASPTCTGPATAALIATSLTPAERAMKTAHAPLTTKSKRLADDDPLQAATKPAATPVNAESALTASAPTAGTAKAALTYPFIYAAENPKAMFVQLRSQIFGSDHNATTAFKCTHLASLDLCGTFSTMEAPTAAPKPTTEYKNSVANTPTPNSSNPVADNRAKTSIARNTTAKRDANAAVTSLPVTPSDAATASTVNANNALWANHINPAPKPPLTVAAK
mmetsp:Transcript_2647/g.5945  ORF Transcript_2647/g.5945 Transcript_2647/m.5945 type:complete len:373 (-) Transcript_2647:264-1382(-)